MQSAYGINYKNPGKKKYSVRKIMVRLWNGVCQNTQAPSHQAVYTCRFSPIQNNFMDGRQGSLASQFIYVYNHYKNTFMRYFLYDGLARKVQFHGHPWAPFDPSLFILIGICKELYLHDNIQALAHLKERIQNSADQVPSKACATACMARSRITAGNIHGAHVQTYYVASEDFSLNFVILISYTTSFSKHKLSKPLHSFPVFYTSWKHVIKFYTQASVYNFRSTAGRE